MRDTSSGLIQTVWNYAHVLKDDGLAFMDYTEQITYLLFLKMAWEQRAATAVSIPSRYSWGTLRAIDDDAKRLARYHQGLRKLSELPGLIGLIFTKPQSKISDPAKLRLLMQMMDTHNWSALDVDVKGEVYEGLLARNADDVRGGAGQYFTPRPVIRAIVEVMRPTARQHIADPACGTGGFLLAAFDFVAPRTTSRRDLERFLAEGLHGVELVPNVARLCAMNLYLRGIGADPTKPAVVIADSLERVPKPVDMVLTNPPFGKKSSVTIVGADGRRHSERLSYHREDFWATTSNKQLSFLQHAFAMLKEDGRAAIVIPDNVLFEGGAGEHIRRSLLAKANVHTLLRLPTGIWYSPGVQANVLFFDKAPASRAAGTEALWVYDLRTGYQFSLRNRPIKNEDLADFVKCYAPEDRTARAETERFRRVSYADILLRDKANLDIQFPVVVEAQMEGRPEQLMQEIVTDLQRALAEFSALDSMLRKE